MCRFEGGIITEPVLYLSLYFKENRETYYNLLQTVRNEGRWENWLTFFLNGILTASQQAIQSAHQINRLFSQDLAKIRELGRARFSCEQVLEYLKQLPRVSIKKLSEALAISSPTARSAVNHLIKLNVLKEISGKKRDKLYIYRNYIDLLEEGTDPL